MATTLTGSVISTAFRNIIFTDKTSSGVGDIYYTDGSNNDVRLSTLTTALTLTAIPTFTSGIKLGSAGLIQDSSGNEAIHVTTTGSALSYLSVVPSATGNPVTLSSAGETNVGLTLDADGSGVVTSTPQLVATLGVKLGNNIIYNSEGTAALTLDTDEDLTIAGDLTVTGNEINSSGAKAITLSSDDVTVEGDLTVTGASSGTMTLGATADGTDRSIKFGHSTLASIIGIDDDQDVFAINTDAAFQATNDFEIAATGVITTGAALITGGSITIPDSANIGSASDTNAIAISADGTVTLTQNIVVSGVGTNTITGPSTFNGKVLLSGNSGNTPGVGITEATTCKSSVERVGTMIKTTIYLDLTGLRHTASGDILGNNGTSNPCHIGQITAAVNGTIVCGQMTCMEVPTASNVDIDLYTSTSGTEVEDTAISGIAGSTISINGGSQTLGKITPFVDDAGLPDANDYLYLTCVSASGDADYAIGKLLFEFWGTV